MAHSTKWDYSKIENFPEGATIQKNGGHLYVIRRTYKYDPAIKRGRDGSRETIGQVVNGVFYTNEQYRQKFQRKMIPRRVPLIPDPDQMPVPHALAEIPDGVLSQLLKAEVRELRIGILPILHNILIETGMMQDLIDCFGKETANVIFSLASFHICSQSKAHRYFNDWAANRHLPIRCPLTDRDVSLLLKNLGIAKAAMEKLFLCRIARNLKDGPMLLSVDSTTVSWNSNNSDDAKMGHGKEGGPQKQVSLVVTFNSVTHQPVLCRRLPGNLTDMKTALDFFTRLDEYGIQNECQAVFDRGYFSEENLLLAYENNAKAIFAAPLKSKFITESVQRALLVFAKKESTGKEERLYLKNGDVQATTVRRMLKVNEKRFYLYVHVFRSKIAEDRSRANLYERLAAFEDLWVAKQINNKSLEKDTMMKFFTISEKHDGRRILVRNAKAITAELQCSGIFVDVTTWKCSAEECFDAYQRRRDIERVFRSGKSNSGLNTHRMHSDLTSEGKMTIMFVALFLLEELKRRLSTDWMKTFKGGTEHVDVAGNTFDFDQVMSGLASVGCMIRKSTGAILVREVTQEQHRMATACGCKGIYETGYTYQDSGI